MPRVERPRSARRPAQAPRRAVAVATALLGTVLALGVMQVAAVHLKASWSTAATRVKIDEWSDGRSLWTDVEWIDAERRLKAAALLTPHDATLQEALGLLHALQGRDIWTTGAPDSEEVEWYRLAIVHQREAVALRPGHALAWANLAVSQSAVGEPLAVWGATWRQALTLGPKEPEVRQILAALALRHWDGLPPDMVAWMEERDPGIGQRIVQQERERQRAEAEAVAAAEAAAAASAAAAGRRAAIAAAAARARAAGY